MNNKKKHGFDHDDKHQNNCILTSNGNLGFLCYMSIWLQIIQLDLGMEFKIKSSTQWTKNNNGNIAWQ
jgi:hypothetical protein